MRQKISVLFFSLLFFSLLFFSLPSLQAQQVHVSADKETGYMKQLLKWNGKESDGYRVGNDIIVVQKSGIGVQFVATARYNTIKHSVSLRKVNASGRELKVNDLEGGEREFGPIPSESIFFAGKVLLFYFKYENKQKMVLYFSEVNPSNLQLAGTRKLFEFDQENVGVLRFRKSIENYIRLAQSMDSSKLLIAVEGAPQELYTCVLDSDLKLVRQKTSRIAADEKEKIEELYIARDGSAVISMALPNPAQTTFFSTLPQRLVMFSPDGAEKVIAATSFSNGRNLINLRFDEGERSGSVRAFGNYAGDLATAGIFIAELDLKQRQVARAKLYPYATDFVQRVRTTGFCDSRRGNHEILEAELDMVEFENGDLAVCGSPLNRYDTRAVMNGKTTGNVTYHAGPVMMMFLQGQQAPVFTMLPRNQWHCGASKSIFIPYNDRLVVIYNDMEKYINQPITDKVDPVRINMARELSLAAAVVKKDGTIESRKQLAPGISRMNYFSIEAARFQGQRQVQIPSYKEEKGSDDLRLVTLSIE